MVSNRSLILTLNIATDPNLLMKRDGALDALESIINTAYDRFERT